MALSISVGSGSEASRRGRAEGAVLKVGLTWLGTAPCSAPGPAQALTSETRGLELFAGCHKVSIAIFCRNTANGPNTPGHMVQYNGPCPHGHCLLLFAAWCFAMYVAESATWLRVCTLVQGLTDDLTGGNSPRCSSRDPFFSKSIYTSRVAPSCCVLDVDAVLKRRNRDDVPARRSSAWTKGSFRVSRSTAWE